MKRVPIILLSSILFFSTTMTLANPNSIALGRYVTTTVAPETAQTELLTQIFDVHFPYDVTTIGQAIRYLLNDSGYQLVNPSSLDPVVSNLLELPLPEVDRHLGPLTLLQGLQTLAGAPFQIVIDPVHRLVAFRLKASFQTSYGVMV